MQNNPKQKCFGLLSFPIDYSKQINCRLQHQRGASFSTFQNFRASVKKEFYIFHNLGKDLRDNLIGQGFLIFGNILKQKFADIQRNWWKILRNIGWSIYTTKAFWQRFPLMRWKKFRHISQICLKLLIILMLQKKIKRL